MNIVEVKTYLKTEDGCPTEFDLAYTLREAKAQNCWINLTYDPMPPYSGKYTLLVKPENTVQELKQLIPDTFPV